MTLDEAKEILSSTDCPKCKRTASEIMQSYCDERPCPVKEAFIAKLNGLPKEDDDYAPGSRH